MDDDSVFQAIGRGSILVDTKVGGCMKRIRFLDVLYVPKLQSNLLSVSKIVEGRAECPIWCTWMLGEDTKW
jgi:hypothetical protein